MTEEEAKTKTCHRTLIPVASADGSAPWHSPQACIGSACMAWRWDEAAFDNWQDWRENVDAIGKPEGSTVEEKTLADFGYCGLAGKP